MEDSWGLDDRRFTTDLHRAAQRGELSTVEHLIEICDHDVKARDKVSLSVSGV